jgi:hypothetical protein
MIRPTSSYQILPTPKDDGGRQSTRLLSSTPKFTYSFNTSRPWKSAAVTVLSLLLLLLLCGSTPAVAFYVSKISPFSTPRLCPPHQRLHLDLSPAMKFSDRWGSSTTTTTTSLFHMGHSHSHHHQHQDGHKVATVNVTQSTSNWIRRLALWLCCWMATCGSTLLKNKKLTNHDWAAFAISSLVVSSAQKGQRAFSDFLMRFQKLKEGVVKHSSFPNANGQNNKFGKSSTAQAIAAIRNTEEADRITWIGVFINSVLSIGKLVVGITQNSSVLIADAGHSLSDLISDFITLWSVNVSRLPPDDDHPYGHYKFEAIGSLFLSLTLIMTGVTVGLHSQKQLLSILKASNNMASSTSALAAAAPGPLALVVAGISIVSKEWLFRVTKAVGEKLNSPVVIANAWHHRSDAYSSILALLSIAWAMVRF